MLRSFPSRGGTVGAAVLVAALTTPAVAQAVQFDKVVVARRGQPAPGGPAGLAFEHFGSDTLFGSPFESPPALDQDGTVVFHAALGDGDPATFETYTYGIWRHGSGVLSVVNQGGDPVPGLPSGTTFVAFPHSDGQTPRAQLGKVLFSAQTSLALPRTGIWSDRNGPLELVLRGDETLLGMPPGNSLSSYAFTMFGRAVLINGVFASGQPDPDDEGLWLDRTGTFERVAVLGQQAPGMPGGVTFSGAGGFFGPIGFWTGNRAGQVLFNGMVDGPGVSLNTDEGVWLGEPGALALIARENQPITVPGMTNARLGSGTGFQSFVAPTSALHVRPVLNDRGDALIGLDFQTPSFDDWVGVFTTRNGVLRHVVTASENFLSDAPLADQAAGFPAGYAYVGFQSGDLSEHGEIVLQGRCSDADVFDQPQGIWVERKAGLGLDLVVGQGRPLPAMPGAITTQVASRGIGDDGNVWCEVFMTGPGITTLNNQALMIERRDGGQQIVLRTGDLFDVDGFGDIRPLQAFVVGPGIDREGGRVVELFFPGGANLVVHLRPHRTLVADEDVVELGAAASVGLGLDLGPQHANRLYVIAGSLSGPSPGVNIGSVNVPVTPDFATDAMLALVNGFGLTGFLGVLDAQGRAQATFSPDLLFAPAFRGQVLTLAGFVPFDAATNAVPVVFRP